MYSFKRHISEAAKMVCKDCGCEQGNPKPGCECTNHSDDLNASCWTSKESYLKACKEEVELEEGKKGGLWDNIHAKRKRIKNGSKEKMRKPGSEGAPTDQDFKDASESVDLEEKRIYKVTKGKKERLVNKQELPTYKQMGWEHIKETTMSAIKRPVNVTGPDGKTRTVMKSAKPKNTDDHGQDKISANESEINDLTALYINENNISMEQLENMTEEELNELIGKAIGGAFKLGAKAVVGGARAAKKVASGSANVAKKTAKSVSSQGRLDRQNKKLAKEKQKFQKAKDSRSVLSKQGRANRASDAAARQKKADKAREERETLRNKRKQGDFS